MRPPISIHPLLAAPKLSIIVLLSVSTFGVDQGLAYSGLFCIVFWLVHTMEVVYLAGVIFVLYTAFEAGDITVIDQVQNPHLRFVPGFVLGILLAPLRGPLCRFVVFIKSLRND